jgi:hypothetical protein
VGNVRAAASLRSTFGERFHHAPAPWFSLHRESAEYATLGDS